MNVEDFILDQLQHAGISYEVHRSFIHVSCPFHAHSGQKKKLGFSRDSGGMNCWVCGKKGHWNEYADLKEMEKFGENDARLQDFGWLRRQFERMDRPEPAVPDWVLPWEHAQWRGLPRDFIREVPSFEWHDEASRANRILWPIYMNGRFKGCTAARLDPKASTVLPKTRNLGGLDSKKILFPFDHPMVRGSEAIALVEGEADVLRLLYNGVPACSIFGAGNWDPHKMTVLGARGVRRLVLAFDGDLAGERLADAVEQDAKTMFDVRIMIFPNPTEEEAARGLKKIDPDNCHQRYIKVIKRMMR